MIDVSAIDGMLAERILSREILGVVEATAIAAGRYMGLGDPVAADKAAMQTMCEHLNKMPMQAKIVIGEGEQFDTPYLHIGQMVGQPVEGMPLMDIAVDAIEGRKLVAKGLPNSISTLVLSSQHGLLHAPKCYMDKLIVGPSSKGKVDINAPVKYNLNVLAMSLARNPEDLTIVILDRPRHQDLIEEVRSAGARIKLISDGDVMPAITAALLGSGIHAVMGIGGAPEGVLAAAAVKCLGGEIQAQFKFESDEERQRAIDKGLDVSPDKVYLTDDLVPGEEIVFAATGITTGDTLAGVRFFGTGARTQSIIMTHQSGVVRFIDSVHMSGSTRGPVQFR
jgi:fructose-1,6-bisphosphatase II